MQHSNGLSGKRWPQHPREIEAFKRFVWSEGVRTYLEVGCKFGDTFYAIGTQLPPRIGRAFALDMPDKRFNKYLQRAAGKLGERFGGMLLADSHSPLAKSWAHSNGPFDLVFIDGDHSYEGAREDWESFGSRAIANRFVAFHDIKPGSREQPGVVRLWQEIQAHHETVELCSDDPAGGIGIVRL